jgi:hypothetical protein
MLYTYVYVIVMFCQFFVIQCYNKIRTKKFVAFISGHPVFSSRLLVIFIMSIHSMFLYIFLMLKECIRMLLFSSVVFRSIIR